MKLSIVSINYKTKEQTSRFIANIASLFSTELLKDELELLIVDNASADESAEYLAKFIRSNKYQNIHLLRNTQNSGFGGGCNFGEQRTRGKAVLFLNNDTQVKDKGILAMADMLMSSQKIGIIGGKLEKPDGSRQLSSWKFYTLFNAILMLLGFERYGMLSQTPNQASQVDWVTGGCMMVKREVFEKIGRFDPNIFMYMEDMELCFRAARKGYQTYYFPETNIMHVGQGSSNRSFAIIHIYKGILYFYKKYMPFWQVWIIKTVLFLKATILVIVGKITHNTYLSETYAKALTALG